MRPAPLRFSLAWLLCAASVRPAGALEVAFTVTDKLGRALAGANVCLQEDPGQCRTTDAQGKTLFAPAVASRPSPERPSDLAFAARAGALLIDAPGAMEARLARYGADGRRLGPALRLDLRPGRNLVPWPAPPAGLAFFRLETERARYVFAALSDAGPAPRLAALGKVAAANLHAFILSKPGFQSFSYRPRKEADTALVRLAAAGDTGIPYLGIIRARLIGIDSANHSLKYAYNQPGCDGATPTSAESQSSLPFWTQNGKWFFPAGNCLGIALTRDGGGSGDFGLWKSGGLEALPAGLLPVACDPEKDSLVTSVPNLFFLGEGGGWDIDLRSDSLTIRIRRRACLGNQLIADPAALDGQNGHPLLAENTCTEVALKNARNETGTYAYATAPDSLRVAFAYGDKTCTSVGAPLTLDTTAPKSCPESQPPALLADTTWQACVRATGFAQ